ncbi:mitochondrial-processing peptidase subunit alpha [Marchantia polymorpha subsp. ruderalis]|uniref:Alpha-MPP n=1 Tax=Marchantia polymorpha TaxID=3197 RepID=A0A2R6X9B1_MARPO|nr:hypothetical protein MARPO_0028s0022 [Marchantia polymorpha]BBN00700.1 hypothetical protein Mp_2g01300 [Marchantia polymorpha subsp. ruderalis]|eukprot:PTQ42696.1 hypothetical protein MARPO_0028s0022 [Marchantia polymorpha]
MLRSSMRRGRLARLARLQQQQREIGTSRIQEMAVPALAKTLKKGGFMSWFGGDQPSTTVPPLYEALEGVRLPPALPDQVKPGQTRMTTLPNGLKIASEDTAGPCATIGVYIDSGSIYEDFSNFGVTHLLERMAFKSTANRSHFRLVREVEAIGGNILANASREQMAYTGDTIKTYMPEMVELLIDSIRNPLFLDWEVKEQLQKVKAEIAEVANNPQSVLLEALHSAGYNGALGHHLLAPESALVRLDGATVAEFVAQNYTAPRIVLAASGVDHEELLAIAEPLLSDMPAVSAPSTPKTEYVGGDWRQAADSPRTHVAIAFEVPGGWRNEKDMYALTVLQSLLGGGGSFSAGGPGKGMYSRLYSRVLNKYEEVQSFTAFNSVYNDTGLFGIHATSSSDFVPSLVDIATKEMIMVATPGSVTEAELNRAKNSTISAGLMNMESRVVVTEDIGRQILTYGHRKPLNEFIEAVQSLTLKDITSISQKLIQTPLTMASWGDVIHVPRFDHVASRFQ